MAILDIYCIYWSVWDRYMQVLILGRAPRTKETLPDFLKWRRVTRPPLVFRGLTGSQRTPGFWGVTKNDGKELWGGLRWPKMAKKSQKSGDKTVQLPSGSPTRSRRVRRRLAVKFYGRHRPMVAHLMVRRV